MKPLNFNYNYAAPFVAQKEVDQLAPAIKLAHQQLHDVPAQAAIFYWPTAQNTTGELNGKQAASYSGNPEA